jgi:hypothetical protein
MSTDCFFEQPRLICYYKRTARRRAGIRATDEEQRAKEHPDATMEKAGDAGVEEEKTAPPLPARATHSVNAVANVDTTPVL